MTVKSEGDLTRQNLNHHRQLGVSAFYVYLDGPDESDAGLRHLSDVMVHRTDPCHATKSSRLPKQLTRDYDQNHIARQLVHLELASVQAEHDGLTWLLNIDADEFVSGSAMSKPSDLSNYLSSMDDECDSVRFPTLELIPTEDVTSANEHAFKAMQTKGGEGFRLPPLKVRSSDLRLDKLAKFWGAPRAELIDLQIPDLDVPMIAVPGGSKFEPFITDWFVGHTQGKCAMRLQRGYVFSNLLNPSSPREHDRLSKQLYIYHYNCASLEDTKRKYIRFDQHPERSSLGKSTDPVKQALLTAARQQDWGRFAELYEAVATYSNQKLEAAATLWPGSIVWREPLAFLS